MSGMTLTWSGLTQGLHTFLQTLIDAEATQHIGADPFQRTDTRTTHRNGTPGQGRLPGGFTKWNMSITFPGSSPDGSGLPGASDGPTAVRKPVRSTGRVDRGLQLGLALTGSSFGDPRPGALGWCVISRGSPCRAGSTR